VPSSHLSPDLSVLFAAQHGLITREQAERNGLTRRMVVRRIAAGLLDEPAPGVLRLVGAPGTWEQRVMGVTLSSRGRAVASHRLRRGAPRPGRLQPFGRRGQRDPAVAAAACGDHRP
jgi:hypothetical protein